MLYLLLGTIRQDCGDGSYLVEDSLGDLEQIYRQDIITDADDADNEIDVHDPVIALHPSFPYSYAPGMESVTRLSYASRKHLIRTTFDKRLIIKVSFKKL